MSADSRRLRLGGHGFIVFLSSALLLVLEITGGRLIAPWVGVRLYSWTSIIGVVLAGLSLGNRNGGRWADRGGGDASTGVALALGRDLLFRTGKPLAELPEFSDDYVPVGRIIAGLLLRHEGR